MQALLGVSRAIDTMNKWIGRIAAWAIVIAILVSAINAIVRKVIGTSSNAWLELQWYLFGAVFMLCTAWTLMDNEHIRIDILANRFSRKVRNWIDVIGHVFFLGAFCAVLIYTSIPFLFLFQMGFAYVGVSSLLVGRFKASEAPLAVVDAAEAPARRAA